MIANRDIHSSSGYEYHWVEPPSADSAIVSQVVSPGLSRASEDFGIAFNPGLPNRTNETPYALFGPLEVVYEPAVGLHPPNAEDTESLKALAEVENIRLNVLMAYRTAKQRRAVTALTRLMDSGSLAWDTQALGLDGLASANLIYPSSLIKTSRSAVITATPEDVVDNISGQTFRITYNDVRDKSRAAIGRLEAAQAEEAGTIEALAKTIHANKLRHRDPTHGSMFVRTNYGWLASHTVTDKSAITADQFSLVRAIRPESNEIVSTGYIPPSSDTPGILTALTSMDDQPRLAVYFRSNGLTHASQDLYIEDHRTDQVVRPTQFDSADLIIGALKGSTGDDGWTVLKGHGVLWTGYSPKDFGGFLTSQTIHTALRMQPRSVRLAVEAPDELEKSR